MTKNILLLLPLLFASVLGNFRDLQDSVHPDSLLLGETIDNLRKKSRKERKKKIDKKKKDKTCNPDVFDLDDFPQWVFETGYWIGELTFYGSDGKPNESASWNYPYDAYKGFITGNINGPAYRQRNVFLYPPQKNKRCEKNNSTVGEGTCGVNGNSKVYFADQRVTTCPEYPNEAGDIEGLFAGVFDTKTELVGKDNALLYQVFYQGCLFQSQLTTLTSNDSTGDMHRTRTAQSFECFNPVTKGRSRNASYYRERKVSKEVFYEELKKYLEEYNVLESDTCSWDGSGLPSPYTPGYDSCVAHLEQTFEPFGDVESQVQSTTLDNVNNTKHYDENFEM